MMHKNVNLKDGNVDDYIRLCLDISKSAVDTGFREPGKL